MLLIRDDGAIRLPEIGKTYALLKRFGNGLPESAAGGNPATTDHTSDHLPSMATQCDPDPPFVGFTAHKRPQFVKLQAHGFRVGRHNQGVLKRRQRPGFF